MNNTNLETLSDLIKTEFPNFKLVQKSESKLMQIIDVFLKIITFGQMRSFMRDFVTTIGTTVYVPSRWDTWPVPSKMAVLRHERVHMRQSRRYGRVLYSFLYLFFPLPVGLAYFRMLLEKEAYEESLRAYVEYYGLQIFKDGEVKDSMVKHFTTAEYFWMWPFRKSLEKWFDDVVDRLTHM